MSERIYQSNEQIHELRQSPSQYPSVDILRRKKDRLMRIKSTPKFVNGMDSQQLSVLEHGIVSLQIELNSAWENEVGAPGQVDPDLLNNNNGK